MGPGFGSGMAEAMVAFVLFVFVLGGLVGVGCYEGCNYVIEHVEVEWK
jgi:hypothetical protein